ncbi:hypothetical protein BOTBODRAFT_45289 [Botryobasidium botryosum FD-172 SS1]|uniref:PCI domain-containing protein n=1 Tax=Botryobasidium botryosum (strain FD-172 SS1) TaxID=930990 RepID=A0A067MP59_BOTB1|nr:hypothetical protein BOTBODRAFT_45289 [Botryobasidium botryosum FD-172 SS1]
MAATKDKETPEVAETAKATPPPPPPKPTPTAEIKANLLLIERAVSTLEPRFTQRVLRTLTSLRKKLTAQVLNQAVNEAYVRDSPAKKALLAYIPTSAEMDIDPPSKTSTTSPNSTSSEPLPESDVYLRLLIILHLIDLDAHPKATELAHETVDKIHALNRRSLDSIAAKVYFYLGRLYEIADKVGEIRPLLLAAQRTASLRRDDDCQATLINLLLSNYLSANLYSQADKLVSKTTFPTSAGNTQLARYLYYLGRIRAVQLSYTEAHTHLQQAIRRASPARTAPGFWQTVHKLFIIVELLMGDIPERGLFRQPVLKKALVPYLQIVRAVRTGDLSQFQSALSVHAEQFTRDKTYTLILRLRHNVIKTGVRALSIAYARISLRDICVKLHLDSEEDAEYIVGKAIRDDVIDARVDHAKGWMVSARRGEGVDGVYATAEPRENFQKRIGFCLDLHNQSVKAMRYPLNAHRKELASVEAAREREKELAKEIVEGDLEDDDDDTGGPMADF